MEAAEIGMEPVPEEVLKVEQAKVVASNATAIQRDKRFAELNRHDFIKF